MNIKTMSNSYIIKCCIPDCNSNSKNDPTKIFVKLPRGTELQKKWVETFGKSENYSLFLDTIELFCCEDHLNLPKDIVNWTDVQEKSRTKLRDCILPCKRKCPESSTSPTRKKLIDTLSSNSTYHQVEIGIQQKIPLEVCENVEVQTKKYIKQCFVPNCKSNSHDNPEKLFITLPSGAEIRKKLAEIFGRNGKCTIFHENSAIFCCTDHLDLPKGVQKWISFKDETTGVIMRIKRQGLPHILSSKLESESQNASKLKEVSYNETSDIEFIDTGNGIKAEPKSKDNSESPPVENIEEVLIKTDPHLLEESGLEPESSEEATSSTINPKLGEEVERQFLQQIQSSQENRKICATQEKIETHEDELVVLRDDIPEHQKLRSFLLSELNKTRSLVGNKPIYINRDTHCNVTSSNSHCSSKYTSTDKKYFSDDVNASFYKERSSQFLKSLNEIMQDNPITTEKSGKNTLLNSSNNLELTTKLIQSFPFRYTGLPTEAFKDFILNMQQGTKLPYNHILLVLLKIRENQSFERLGDAFGIFEEEALTIFFKSVPTISNYLKEKIAWPKMNTESQIPLPDKLFFENIKLIIDCLEVEVEKPITSLAADILKSLETDSYIVKYLISYTPVGLINCITQGYGGSRTDDFLIQHSGYLSGLNFRKNVVILTDTNFSQTENLFSQRNCKLIRLEEEKEVQIMEEFAHMKVLQQYVQNVMKRLREFKYISCHASLNHQLTSVLDFVVIIASAIVNAQGALPFKTQK